MRCNFPIRNLTCSKSFNSKSNALSFLYSKSYVLKFPATPNLTLCTTLNTKTEACFLQNPLSWILFCSNTDMLQNFISKPFFLKYLEKSKICRFHGEKEQNVILCMKSFLKADMLINFNCRIWCVVFISNTKSDTLQI